MRTFSPAREAIKWQFSACSALNSPSKVLCPLGDLASSAMVKKLGNTRIKGAPCLSSMQGLWQQGQKHAKKNSKIKTGPLNRTSGLKA